MVEWLEEWSKPRLYCESACFFWHQSVTGCDFLPNSCGFWMFSQPRPRKLGKIKVFASIWVVEALDPSRTLPADVTCHHCVDPVAVPSWWIQDGFHDYVIRGDQALRLMRPDVGMGWPQRRQRSGWEIQRFWPFFVWKSTGSYGKSHEIRCFGGVRATGDMAARQLCPVAMAPKWVCWQGWWVWPENHLLSLLLVYDISTVYMYLCIYIYIYICI